MLARRQTQIKVQGENHKENEGDTSALETINAADTLANSQKALIARVQQENPGLTGTGLIAQVQQYLAKQTNDPLVQEITKNQAQLTASNYPHGGALRNAQLKTAADQAAGTAQSPIAGTHLLDQQIASRALTREVLQARQNFIATHPQEDPTIAFDPIANSYLAGHPAYTEGPNGIVPAQPGLAAFDQAHTNPQTGRFDPNYAAVQAGQRAFPSGAPQATDPVAAVAGAKAFPQTTAATSVPAQAATTGAASDPATLIRQRLAADPQFRARAVQQRGQAWVQSFEGGN